MVPYIHTPIPKHVYPLIAGDPESLHHQHSRANVLSDLGSDVHPVLEDMARSHLPRAPHASQHLLPDWSQRLEEHTGELDMHIIACFK